jgi:Leucine-rich repeat (LRR) protein
LSRVYQNWKPYRLPTEQSNPLLSLPDLTKLRQIDLRKNQLQEVELHPRCPQIETIHFGGNQLKEFTLPTGFGNLLYLYLADNQIETLTLNSFLSHLLTLASAE